MTASDTHPAALGDDGACDCVVVGAGPAGLTAALYLRRYRRRVLVVDHGHSRAHYIDRSRNCPGFPEGLSGSELLGRMRRQLAGVGGDVHEAEVSALRRCSLPDAGEGFELEFDGRSVRARSVLLATGVVDHVPDLPGIDAARQGGLLRQCPICDGHEHRGQRIAVIGDGEHAAREAAFLATYSTEVSLVGLAAPPAESAPALGALGVTRLPARAKRVIVSTRGGAPVTLRLADGSQHGFDVLYAALGTQPRVQLARPLGAAVDARNNLVVDAHCRTSVPGLYAAGDVVSALDQIAVAIGHGAIAATAIHNALPARPAPGMEIAARPFSGPAAGR